jgi:hypothetical protein
LTLTFLSRLAARRGIVQRYVGRRTPVLDRVVERFEKGRAVAAAERERTERLCAQLRVAGALVTDAPTTRILAGLADAAVFRLGGVLVGTHAFIVLGNLLGVRWTGAGLRTEDVDKRGRYDPVSTCFASVSPRPGARSTRIRPRNLDPAQKYSFTSA